MSEAVRSSARLALLLALATVIHTAEAFLPVTVVWFRFGFANIVGLATLYLFGFGDAVFVTVARIFLGSLVTGLFGSPAFVLSAAGGVCAILVMGLARRYCGRIFSEVGVSVLGALAHNLAQLLTAYALIVRHEGVFLMLPLLMIAAIVTGCLNGLAARFLIEHFRKVADMG